jgi:hypothetical protein
VAQGGLTGQEFGNIVDVIMGNLVQSSELDRPAFAFVSVESGVTDIPSHKLTS